MQKIIIIGNSAAGFSAAKLLSQQNQKFEVTVISKEEHPCYRKDMLIDYFKGAVSDDDIFIANDKFYQDKKIVFLKNSEVIRVDTKRQTVALKDKAKIDYDFLIIASGEKVKIPDIPGKSKSGVVPVYTLDSIKEVKEKLILANNVSIIGENNFAIKLTKALLDNGKEVKLIGQVTLLDYTHGSLEIIRNVSAGELIGESREVQALKLDNGKAIGADLILFVDNYIADTDFLKDSNLIFQNGYIIVDSNMRTNINNIFACGSVARKKEALRLQKDQKLAASEGIIAAQNIMNLTKEGEIACQKS